jgi:hypothetical protein
MEAEGLHILADAPASALNGADRTG